MTIPYTLDVSHSSTKSFCKLLLRWRGSIWKAVLHQLLAWTLIYMIISLTYRYLLSNDLQSIFDKIAIYLSKDIYQILPLTFMLGFFVTFVVSRWLAILSGIGWIDNSAIAFATFIHGDDEETKLLRRTLIRYMVLNQALVLRDISMQVRKRFPTLETLIAAGFVTENELKLIEAVNDHYSRYWVPLEWCHQHLCQARKDGKIPNDNLLGRSLQEIHTFQQGLATLLKYDWVPVPLVYPQIVFISVRIYFILCLISRQFLRGSPFDIWIPFTTMLQFVVYMGWMKVAEMLLNPLGDDDDDLECNYVIDKNLITGLTLVERGSMSPPEMEKDVFWNEEQIAPLYTKSTAKRHVTPLIGSAASLNLLHGASRIKMMPHRNVFKTMDETQRANCIKIVEIVPPLTRTAVTISPKNQGQMFDANHDEEKIPLNNLN